MSNPILNSTVNLKLRIDEMEQAEAKRLEIDKVLVNVDQSVYDTYYRFKDVGASPNQPETLMLEELLNAHDNALYEVKEAFDRVREQYTRLEENMREVHRPRPMKGRAL